MENKINQLRKSIKINRLIILIMWIFTLILTIIATNKLDASDEDELTCEKSYRHKLELDYWHAKSEVVDLVQQYINTYAPESDLSAIVLVDQCIDYNVDIKFVLVQGLVESHFGTKGLAKRTNSVWNAGAYDNFTEDRIYKHYKYRHPDQSVKPYLKLLTSRYLVNKTEEELLDNFVDTTGSRYASYKHYESELKVKLTELKGTKLDSLLSVLYKTKLRLNR